jgi:hypothetical protein
MGSIGDFFIVVSKEVRNTGVKSGGNDFEEELIGKLKYTMVSAENMGRCLRKSLKSDWLLSFGVKVGFGN